MTFCAWACSNWPKIIASLLPERGGAASHRIQLAIHERVVRSKVAMFEVSLVLLMSELHQTGEWGDTMVGDRLDYPGDAGGKSRGATPERPVVLRAGWP